MSIEIKERAFTVIKVNNDQYGLVMNGNLCPCHKVPPIITRHPITGDNVINTINCTTNCVRAKLTAGREADTYWYSQECEAKSFTVQVTENEQK
jgi:hypothetical protein